ncbi:hypothetical protein GCM10010975_15370 [Comamonas phosphati]|nr:hypothetical protein GCM10010975_15370 [Comamonas phosphati]
MLKFKSLRIRPLGLALSVSAVLAAGAFQSGAQAAEPAGAEPAAAAHQAPQDQQHAQVKAQREAERAEIARKRTLIENQQTAAEALCYKKFAVEDCLLEARREAREKEAPLRARELEMNGAERRERAAERLKQIEEKKASKAAAPMKGQQRDKMPDAATPDMAPAPSGKGPKPPVDEQGMQQQRSQEAQQRAAKQADYVQRRQADQQRRQAETAEREPKARAEYEAKLKAAAEHRAKALQAAKEKGQTAAPLPPPKP